MTYTIKLTPPSEFDYRGLFFENLQVTVFEQNAATTHASEHEKLHARLFGSGSQRTLSPTVSKVYHPSDRRYNAIRRDWKLSELIEKLEAILLFGPVQRKQHEQHSSFSVIRDRAEDRLVTVSDRGICLNEWPLEPLYCLGDFDSFEPVILGLKDIQAYLREQGR